MTASSGSVSFTVRGDAAPYRERARIFQPASGKARVWSSKTKNTSDHQAHLKRAAEDAMAGRAPIPGPVRLTMRVFFAPPASWPKWKIALLESGLLAHTQKPDWDNLRKAAIDALKSVVIVDDSQICRESDDSGKFYDQIPRTEITIEPLPFYPSQIKTKPGR